MLEKSYKHYNLNKIELIIKQKNAWYKFVYII